jgi:hypothetical protein
VKSQEKLMDVKDFSKYLKHKSFDELLHHVRRISLERVTDNEFPERIFLILTLFVVWALGMLVQVSDLNPG